LFRSASHSRSAGSGSWAKGAKVAVREVTGGPEVFSRRAHIKDLLGGAALGRDNPRNNPGSVSHPAACCRGWEPVNATRRDRGSLAAAGHSFEALKGLQPAAELQSSTGRRLIELMQSLGGSAAALAPGSCSWRGNGTGRTSSGCTEQFPPHPARGTWSSWRRYRGSIRRGERFLTELTPRSARTPPVTSPAARRSDEGLSGCCRRSIRRRAWSGTRSTC